MTKIRRKIQKLEKRVAALTEQLIPMARDERHPLSRDFPSQASRDGMVTELRHQLERAQEDLNILRMLRSRKILFRDQTFYKKTADDFRQCKENLQKGEIELRAKMAMLDRAKALLR